MSRVAEALYEEALKDTSVIVEKMQSALSKINSVATKQIKECVAREGLILTQPADIQRFIRYCYGVSTAYGEAAAAVACEAYDALGLAAGLILEPAVPAEVATMHEVAKAIEGTLKTSQNVEELSGAVTRYVKRTGQDTLLKNAYRDHAQAAWVPSGDTCAFCIMLASRGWEYVSKKAAQSHAEHIHSNCDCTYAVRFDTSAKLKGYDPDKYYQQYKDAEGSTTEEKLNSMRRRYYAENKEQILAQKADAYAKRMELNSSAAEETKVD